MICYYIIIISIISIIIILLSCAVGMHCRRCNRNDCFVLYCKLKSKLHLWFCHVCVSLVDNMPSVDTVKPASTDETSVETVVEMDMLESPLVLDAAVEDEIDKIVKCLEEIARVLANPDSVIVCGSVFLLLTCIFCMYSGFLQSSSMVVLTNAVAIRWAKD